MFLIAYLVFFTILKLAASLPASFLPASFLPRDDGGKSYLVNQLPGLESLPADDVPLMYSGQIKVYDDKDDYIFFWKIIDQHKVERNKDRLIIWLNGGPGCSSMDGALMESGPFRINSDLDVEYNEGSWHKLGDMLYVDQPLGTGYSYTAGDYATSVNQSTDTFLDFMDKYFEIFPDDAKLDLIISGESFAGQYIPYIADRMLTKNKENGNTTYNLKGLMIGNGYVSPVDQGASYLPFAIDHNLVNSSSSYWGRFESQQQKCQALVDKLDTTTNFDQYVEYANSGDCEAILTLLMSSTSEVFGKGMCVNVYDYELSDTYPSCGMNWPPSLNDVTSFLGELAVMDDLNLQRDVQWTECSNSVYSQIYKTALVPSVLMLPSLLEQIPIMFFNGDLDIICNWMGTLSLINKLTWNGAKGFTSAAANYSWLYEDEPSGTVISERNLTFVKVFNASHMVPYNKPEQSRSLIDIMTGYYKVEGDDLLTFSIDSDESASALKATYTRFASAKGGVADGSKSVTETHSHKTSIWEIARDLLIACTVFGMIYVAYYYLSKKKHSSLRAGSGNGIRKNVQWADELDPSDEVVSQETLSKSIISSTLDALRGNSKDAQYSRAPTMELDEMTSNNTDGFIVGSDDESRH